MTKYDPFSFGMLPAGKPAAEAPAGEAPAGDDDLDGALFAAPASAAKADVAADGWEPLMEAVEAAASPAAGPAAPPVPPPARVARQAPPAGVVAAPPPKPAPQAPPRSRPAPAPPRQLKPLPLPKPPGVLALLLPLGIFGAGGTASAFCFLMQQNPVMGGILGAVGVCGAALAWVALRR